MSDVQKIQMVILMPPALADAAAKLAAEKLTSRSTWVRQLIQAALKKEAAQDAA
jgi:metal-responsive CopG/Arc/MetJ family transcriptional regulator